MYYKIIEINGKIRESIDIKGKANKYGECKKFTLEDAEIFIKKHTYKGMSHSYEIVQI